MARTLTSHEILEDLIRAEWKGEIYLYTQRIKVSIDNCLFRFSRSQINKMKRMAIQYSIPITGVNGCMHLKVRHLRKGEMLA